MHTNDPRRDTLRGLAISLAGMALRGEIAPEDLDALGATITMLLARDYACGPRREPPPSKRCSCRG